MYLLNLWASPHSQCWAPTESILKVFVNSFKSVLFPALEFVINAFVMLAKKKLSGIKVKLNVNFSELQNQERKPKYLRQMRDST